MPDNVTRKQIEALDHIWHRAFIYSIQYDLPAFGNALEEVTTLEIAVLEMVESKPTVLLKEILESTGVPASTLTGALDRLENRGLLNRTISKRDRRSFGLRLTEDGRSALAEHRKAENRFFAKVLAVLESGERERFLGDLKRIVEHLSDSAET
jgi:DNA-binding MarR family transcriptional regulator